MEKNGGVCYNSNMTTRDILLVEDEPGHAALIRKAFIRNPLQNANIIVKETIADAKEYLHNTDNKPLIVLTDQNLPDGKGDSLVQLVGGDVPVVLMTSLESTQLAVEVVRAGAVDYVVKSQQSFGEMPAVCERALRTWGHIQAKRKVEDDLRKAKEELERRVEERTGELRRSEELYRLLVTHAQSFIVRFDENGMLMYANALAVETFGLIIEEGTPSYVQDFLSLNVSLSNELSDNGLHTLFHAAVGSTQQLIEQNRTKSGEFIWVAWTHKIYEDPVTGRREIISVGVDISEIRKAETERDRLLQMMEASARAAHIALWQWTTSTNQRNWVSIVDNMLGVSSGQFEHTMEAWLQRLHPEDQERVRASLEMAVAQNTIFSETYRIRHEDGSYRWWTDTAEKLFAEGDRETMVAGACVDITSLKNLQEELSTARQQADAANRAKSQFLANMSHEIRTPMNAILGMTQLALQTELTDRQRNYLQKVANGGKSLLRIINDILDFSKIEAGRLEVERVSFSLDNVFRDLGDLITERAQDKELELLFDLDPELPKQCFGDPLRLGQVLINLAGNAIKFTEKGEVRIRVTRLDGNSQVSHIRFDVLDSGIGMDAEQMAKLFQPFSQADSSTTRKFGGTGLGLSISSRLVELMGGSMSVESELGKGSKFSFELSLPVDTSAPSSTQSLRPIQKDLRKMTILLIDDNASAREIISSMLLSQGLKCVQAVSGNDALQRVATTKEHFGLVIVDWRMPDLDGIQTIQILRHKNPEYTSVPVIMITAHGNDRLSNEWKEMGIQEILTKPFSASQLTDSMMTVLGYKSGNPVDSSMNDLINGQCIPGAHLLLVEDNEVNRELAREVLMGLGASVDEAFDGVMALEMIQTHGVYDAVLMDCQMPRMDGFEATEIIRTQLKIIDMPIIAMTANARPEDRQRCLLVGMNEHVAKPLDMKELVEALKRWVPVKSEQRSLPQNVPSQGSSNVHERVFENVLPHIDVVDQKSALLRINGRQKLYKELLQGFYNTHYNFDADYRKAMAEGKKNDAVRMVHTLKGLAATIGANALATTVQSLEKALHTRDEAPELYQQMLSQLQEVLQWIPHSENSKEVSEERTANPPIWFDQMKTLLEQDDADAVGLAEEWAQKGDRQAKWLLPLLKKYDFAGALVQLNHWRVL